MTPGSVFFCVSGFTRDGHDFAPAALERGAAALVVDRPLGLGVPEILVADVRAAMAPAAARINGDPTARLADRRHHRHERQDDDGVPDARPARGRRDRGPGCWARSSRSSAASPSSAVRTTPEAIDLQATFAAMLGAGDEACVMEVSSHALELHRADAIHWRAAVFTNLTQDHLDFHPTMDDYFAAKRRLLDAGPAALRVINVDDPYGRRLAEEHRGRADGRHRRARTPRLRARDLRADFGGTTLRRRRARAARRRCRAPSTSSTRCAPSPWPASSASRTRRSPPRCRRAATAPGRFQPVDEGQDYAVLVDYAHTPDSLENVLRAARGLARGRVIAVFGCGGDRDRGKRPLMGEIAAREADRVDRHLRQPALRGPGRDHRRDPRRHPRRGRGPRRGDRGPARGDRARRRRSPRRGDVVVIAGKGHEQGQELAGGRKVPFDDAAVAREALRAALAR